jgi:hypothetical protein
MSMLGLYISLLLFLFPTIFLLIQKVKLINHCLVHHHLGTLHGICYNLYEGWHFERVLRIKYALIQKSNQDFFIFSLIMRFLSDILGGFHKIGTVNNSFTFSYTLSGECFSYSRNSSRNQITQTIVITSLFVLPSDSKTFVSLCIRKK